MQNLDKRKSKNLTLLLLTILILLVVFFALSFYYTRKHNSIFPTQVFTENLERLETKNILATTSISNIENVYLIGEYTVSRIVDGDTIHAYDKSGKDDNIRFLAVNTPETHNASKREICLGKLAKEYTTKNLSGKKVELWGDKTQNPRDVYNRLLAYVLIKGATSSEFYNGELMKEGLARIYKAKPPAVNYNKYLDYETEAKLQMKGIWNESLCR